jgi:predicted  nucleic acid-binding Zn-ribbon protein
VEAAPSGKIASYGARREAEISVLQRELRFVRRTVSKLREECAASTDERQKISGLMDTLRVQHRKLQEVESEIFTLRSALGTNIRQEEISDLLQIVAEAKSEKLVLLKELSDLEISCKNKQEEISALESKLQKIGDVGQDMSESEMESEIFSIKRQCDELKCRERSRAAEISTLISGLERELAQLRSAGEATTTASSREKETTNYTRKYQIK